MKWKQDWGLQSRMLLTMVLLAVVYLAFLTVLASLGVGTATLLVVAVILVAVQYFFSDKLVLRTTGARIVSDREFPALHETVTRLCAIAGLPVPGIALVNSPMPNAFATGRSPGKSVVAVTSGLLDRLTPEELESVLAHELSHIKNRDTMILTIASFLSTVAFFMVRSSPYFRVSGQNRGAGAYVLVMIASLLVWVVSYLLIRALSRYREFAADRGSALITGHPSHLASALMKISGMMANVPTRDLRQAEGMNAFYIIPAISGSSVLDLFSTHPPVEKRIAALERIEKEMEFR